MLCSINPPTANLAGANISVAVTIATSRQQAALADHRREMATATISWLAVLFWLPFLRFGRFLQLRQFTRLRSLLQPRESLRESKMTVRTSFLLISLLIPLAIGCAGGGSPANLNPPPAASVTPQGTYTVNFTVTGPGISRTIPLTLIVH
jgi:hypothetical protein